MLSSPVFLGRSHPGMSWFMETLPWCSLWACAEGWVALTFSLFYLMKSPAFLISLHPR